MRMHSFGRAMKSKRRLLLAFAVVLPVIAHVACSGNGDVVPNPIYDASALDVGVNPNEPGNGPDGAPRPDAAIDAPVDAPKDAPAPRGPVQINELYIDTLVDGDGTEFVELRGAPGTPVDDLKLRLVHADGKVKYEVPVGVVGDKLDVNGLWVVGGATTFKLNVGGRVDRIVSLSGWGLDSPGAVQVVRGTTLLDVVGYDEDPDAGALPPLTLPPTATFEGAIALVPDNRGAGPGTKRKTLGRKTGAADTNNNRADFCTMEGSPGLAQKACQ